MILFSVLIFVCVIVLCVIALIVSTTSSLSAAVVQSRSWLVLHQSPLFCPTSSDKLVEKHSFIGVHFHKILKKDCTSLIISVMCDHFCSMHLLLHGNSGTASCFPLPRLWAAICVFLPKCDSESLTVPSYLKKQKKTSLPLSVLTACSPLRRPQVSLAPRRGSQASRCGGWRRWRRCCWIHRWWEPSTMATPIWCWTTAVKRVQTSTCG